ncbi:uncharacterized protein V1518DRAFT_422460 [Limtongia smithiae]|uniref:uncharacterized protein n=1 Tax=Limtongia smithiae TaxID=1125753 RepID=UPI0034CD5541
MFNQQLPNKLCAQSHNSYKLQSFVVAALVLVGVIMPATDMSPCLATSELTKNAGYHWEYVLVLLTCWVVISL